LWKIELGNLANELGLVITLPHPPPGKSKWNKSEHWLFSFIAANWRCKPLVSHRLHDQAQSAGFGGVIFQRCLSYSNFVFISCSAMVRY
jgi:hypothetical protein